MEQQSAMPSYQAEGKLFETPTMTGNRGLVSLAAMHYEPLLALGIMNEEVDLTLTKANVGIEYAQGAPTYRTKAGLYTIKMDGIVPKPQLDLDQRDMGELAARGFRDGDAVIVDIVKLPYRVERSASYDDLNLDVTL